MNLNKIIKSYFNLHFKNKFIHLKHMSLKRRNSLLRRIYVSNIEIKHTNNKALITLYVINTQKKTLSKRYEKSKKFFENRSEEHTSELQSRENLVCRLLLEKKKI